MSRNGRKIKRNVQGLKKITHLVADVERKIVTYLSFESNVVVSYIA